MLTHALGRNTFGAISNTGNVLNRNEANELLHSWVQNERLKLHMQQVAFLMRCWAQEKENLNSDDQWKWELAGLLHDADWDQWPDDHCKKIIEELEKRNIDPEIIHAIASHGPRYFGVDPKTKMGLMLYAFDELSGFIHAYSLMRPNSYAGMEVKGVLKRLKDKTFAANVNRDDIKDASERCGITIEKLIQFIIDNQKKLVL
ncbi:MAG: HD domain-containing protein [Fimbriimonadaceae bacterium]|nr:HD domain-containing protein [Chitinophagales bacterium]